MILRRRLDAVELRRVVEDTRMLAREAGADPDECEAEARRLWADVKAGRLGLAEIERELAGIE